MRVIAGSLRGRRLRAPAGLTTRPTADRVRESLFAVLGDLRGLRVVDLYAGTGALGIEALSRGAASATFIDSGRDAVDVLRSNLRELGVDDRATVLPTRVERCKNRLRDLGPFDLILCDPPWPIASDIAGAVFLLAVDVLAPDGRLVFGHRAKTPISDAPSGLKLRDQRKWGQAAMRIFQASDGSAETTDHLATTDDN